MPHFCVAHGFFWAKRIIVGPKFRRLTAREAEAVLLHEVGHCKLRHAEKRVLAVLMSWRVTVLYLKAMWRVGRRFRGGLSSTLAQRMIESETEAILKAAPALAALHRRQELEADTFAAACGYGVDLVQFFRRITHGGGAGHPTPDERVAHLEAILKESSNGLHSPV